MSKGGRTFGGGGCLLAAAWLGGLGCGGSTPKATADSGVDTGTDTGADPCPTGGNGALTVTVTGLPAGATPYLQLNGAGLSKPVPLTTGQAATAPAGPNYVIEWARVKAAPATGGVIGRAYYLGSKVFDGCLKAGAAATLNFVQEPGSEKMWATVSNTPVPDRVIAGFTGGDLVATGTHAPTVWKSKNFTGRGSGSAFDSSGNLWVPGGDRVNMYDMTTLAMSGDMAPAVMLTQPDSASANFAAFDADGNLWVTRGAPTTDVSIVRYGVADLAVGGSPTPGVVITSAALANPSGLAFDVAGNLWVASEGNGSVVKFNAARLNASYGGAPDVVLTAATTEAAYSHPIALAFDRAGNLWASFLDNVVKFTPAQQASTPAAPINAPFALKVSTYSLVFGEDGSLWVDEGGNAFKRLPAASLATAGEVSPDIVISSDDVGNLEKIVMDPSPTWSPLNDGPRAP